MENEKKATLYMVIHKDYVVASQNNKGIPIDLEDIPRASRPG